jgi:hypothetical protein
MTPEEIEQEIRRAIETENDAVTLSNRLFSQDHGLFPLLGATEADRRRIVSSPLFREAQQRIRDLEYAEVEFIRRKDDPEAREWKLLCGALVPERDQLRYERDKLREGNEQLKKNIGR